MSKAKRLDELTAWQRKWLHWTRDDKERWRERVDQLVAEGFLLKCAQYEAYMQIEEER